MSGDAALAQSYVDSIVIAALADEIGGRLGEASQRISRAAADVSHPSLTSHATRLNARLVRANPNGALQARLQALRPKIDADTSLSGRFARAIVLHLEDKPIDSAKELFSILKTERGDDSPFEFAALQYLAREEIQVALTTTLARSIAHGDVLEATVAQRERTIETMLRNRKNALQ